MSQLLLVLNVLLIYLWKHIEINNQQMPLQAEKYQRQKNATRSHKQLGRRSGHLKFSSGRRGEDQYNICCPIYKRTMVWQRVMESLMTICLSPLLPSTLIKGVKNRTTQCGPYWHWETTLRLDNYLFPHVSVIDRTGFSISLEQNVSSRVHKIILVFHAKLVHLRKNRSHPNRSSKNWYNQ